MRDKLQAPISWLPAGFAAGMIFGALDVVLALSSGRDLWTCLALLELCAVAGVLLALLARAAFSLCRWLQQRSGLPRWVFEAALSALVAVPLGRQIFSGAGVRRTLLGHVGPWLFPPLAALCTTLLLAALWHAVQGGSAGRRATAVTALALAAGVRVADRHWLIGGYAYLHVLLALFALALLALACGLLAPRVLQSPKAGIGVFSFCALGMLPVALAFPHDNATRMFLVERDPMARRVMSTLAWLVDLDRDGSSPLFVGGDCNDLDANVSPLHAEIAGNHIDDDCDGSDAALGSIRRDYGGSRARAAAVAALAAGRPTVVMLIDALRADRVGRGELPNLSRLARESAYFTRAFAPATSTKLSVPAIMTGLPLVAPSDRSVFEDLRSAGMTTAFVAADIVAKTIAEDNRATGALYYPFLRGFERKVLITTKSGSADDWGGGVKTPTDHQVTDAAFALLDGPAPPDLLWVHYFDLHQWQILDGIGAEGHARYDEILRRLDAELGRWLVRADRINLLLLSDHGEALGDHDLETHTAWLWSALAHVPFMLRIPGLAPARIESAVSVGDLAPTLRDLYGRSAPQDVRFSVLPLIGIPDPGRSDFIGIEFRHIALLDGHHRLVFDLETRAVWLFDVLADVEERQNRAATDPARASRMLRELLARRAAAQERYEAAATAK